MEVKRQRATGNGAKRVVGVGLCLRSQTTEEGAMPRLAGQAGQGLVGVGHW